MARFEYIYLERPPDQPGYKFAAEVLNEWGAGGWHVVAIQDGITGDPNQRYLMERENA